MDRELNQAFMVRPKLQNKFLRLKTQENRIAYVSQHILNINSISDNKLFWKTMCPLFSDKKLFKS